MPPADASGFFGSTAGPSPFGGGAFSRRNAFDLSGIPGLSGNTGMVAGMMLQQLLPQILGPNYIAGPFAPQGQNLQMHQQTIAHFQQRQLAMELGAKQDQETYYRMLRGGAHLAGLPFNERSAREQAATFSLASPMFAEMAPEWFDRMHGPRGSAALMGGRMVDAGRMAFDPETGRMGMSGRSAGQLAKDVNLQLYGGRDSLVGMSGLRQGQAGAMFEQMMQRGLGPANAGMDASAVSSSMKNMAGAVKAVQEIFGDMGHPDAPMNQIFNALQQLTQGGAGRFSPAELEKSVRTTYTLAKMTRMGIDQAQGFAAELAQSADRIGLDRSFVPGVTQGAMAAGFVYGNSGLASSGFRSLSKEEFTKVRGQLGVQAAGSQQATQLGTLMALGEQGELRAGTAAHQMYQAVKGGKATYGDGQDVFMSPEKFTALMRAGGANEGVINSLRMNDYAMQEYVQRFGVDKLVLANQGKIDVDPFLSRMYQGSAFMALAGAGMGGDKARDLSVKIGIASVRAMRNMDPTTRRQDTLRNSALVKSLRDDPTLGPALRDMSDQQLARIGIMGFANAEGVIGRTMPGFKGMFGMLDSTSPEIIARGARMMSEVAGITEVQSAVAGLGQHGVLERLSLAMQRADGTTSMQDIIAQSLGGISKSETTMALEARYRELAGVGRELHKATRAGNAVDMAKYREEAKALVGEINRVVDASPDRDRIIASGGAGAARGGGGDGRAGPPTRVVGTLRITHEGTEGDLDVSTDPRGAGEAMAVRD